MNPAPFPNNSRWRSGIIVLAMVFMVLATYWPVTDCDFVNYDDTLYVTENPQVLKGLNWDGAEWAFQGGNAGNWHPLTWLSHMADVTLFGVSPKEHHLVNLSLHILNTLLLWLLLVQTTRAFWRSAAVAALFALHPLHVESVAWVSERKDVLSTFFLLLTLLAYAGYVRNTESGNRIEPPRHGGTKTETEAKNGSGAPGGPSRTGARPTTESRNGLQRWGCYGLALIFFALGLMSKPMLVTLPCVLLLMDFWPLSRFQVSGFKLQVFKPVLVEKIPFMILSFISAALTIKYQSEAGAVGGLTLESRIANALASYSQYLFQTVWPVNLAVFYPLNPHLPAWKVGCSFAFLVAVSVLLLRQARRLPALATGWLWFLGTLVPVIGIIQAGQQAHADRYTYVPAIGVFILVIWGFGHLATRFTQTRWWLTGATVGSLVILAFCANRQLGYWKDSITLFEHAISVTRNNHVAHNNLAAALLKLERVTEAKHHAEEAIRIQPNSADAHLNLGICLVREQNYSEAQTQLEKALALRANAETEYNLAKLFDEIGDRDAAIRHYQSAIASKPEWADPHYNLALSLMKQGRWAEAESGLRQVLKISPDRAEAQLTLGAVLAQQGRQAEAINLLKLLIQKQPANADAFFNLGKIYMDTGQPAEALQAFETVIRLAPGDLTARQSYTFLLIQTGNLAGAIHQLQAALEIKRDAPTEYQLGLTFALAGRFGEAIAALRRALELRPDWPAAMNDLAWMLATAPDEADRRTAEAVAIAEKACAMAGQSAPRFYGTRDAAYAANGQFDLAMAAARQTIELAKKSGDAEAVQLAEERLRLYQNGQAYRQTKPAHAEDR